MCCSKISPQFYPKSVVINIADPGAVTVQVHRGQDCTGRFLWSQLYCRCAQKERDLAENSCHQKQLCDCAQIRQSASSFRPRGVQSRLWLSFSCFRLTIRSDLVLFLIYVILNGSMFHAIITCCCVYLHLSTTLWVFRILVVTF